MAMRGVFCGLKLCIAKFVLLESQVKGRSGLMRRRLGKGKAIRFSVLSLLPPGEGGRRPDEGRGAGQPSGKAKDADATLTRRLRRHPLPGGEGIEPTAIGGELNGPTGKGKVWLIVGLCVLVLMILVAFNRRNVNAGLNVPIRFDDFAFTVVAASKNVGEGIPPGRAHYVVSLQIANRAKRVDFRFKTEEAVLIDAAGREYHVSAEAQRALETATGQPDPTAKPLPAGTTVVKDLVFDVPREVEQPHMKVMSGGPVGAVLETVFFGRKQFVLP
jgi:hypothetical protein